MKLDQVKPDGEPLAIGHGWGVVYDEQLDPTLRVVG